MAIRVLQSLVFTLAWSLLVPLAEAKPELGFYKSNERFPILTYEEFRRLSNEDQGAYLKLTREFFASLEQSNLRTASLRPDFLQMLLALNPTAEAAQEECQLRKTGTDYCLFCPTYARYQVGGPQGGGQICGRTIEDLHRRVSQPSNEFTTQLPQVGVSLTQLKALEERALDEGAVPFRTEVTPQDGVVRTVITPAGKKVVPVPEEEIRREVNEAGPIERIDRIENGQVVESNSNQGGQNLEAPAADTRREKAEADAAAAAAQEAERQQRLQDKDKFGKEIRCLYAGFPIVGAVCTPKTHFTSDDKKTTYACDSKNLGDTTSMGQILTPKPPKESEKILCNPLLFGTTADNQPFCVAKGGNATRECIKKADRAPESLQKAAEIQKANAKTSRELIWTLTKLCHGDEATLKQMLAGRMQRSADKVVADIKKTCNDFGERFSAFYNQYRDGARGGSGQR